MVFIRIAHEHVGVQPYFLAIVVCFHFVFIVVRAVKREQVSVLCAIYTYSCIRVAVVTHYDAILGYVEAGVAQKHFPVAFNIVSYRRRLVRVVVA
jgi:hypothetical protein